MAKKKNRGSKQKGKPLQTSKARRNDAETALPTNVPAAPPTPEVTTIVKKVAKRPALIPEPAKEEATPKAPVAKKLAGKPKLEKPTAPSSPDNLHHGVIAAHRFVDNKLLFTRILERSTDGKVVEVIWFKPDIHHAVNTTVSFETYLYKEKPSAINVTVTGARTDLNELLQKAKLRTMFYSDFLRLVLEGKDPKDLSKGLIGVLDGNSLVFND